MAYRLLLRKFKLILMAQNTNKFMIFYIKNCNVFMSALFHIEFSKQEELMKYLSIISMFSLNSNFERNAKVEPI